MTFSDDSPGSERSYAFSDLRRRYFQKRYLFSWILAVLLPFILLRLLFLSEIAFPFQAATVRSPSTDLQPQENVSQGQASIVGISLPPAPGPKDVTSEKIITDSTPVIRPDEDAWITHDDWISHDLNQTEKHNFLPPGFENSTEFMKDFSPVSPNGVDFGLPEDNAKEELQFETTEMIQRGENKSEENTTVKEFRPQENEGAKRAEVNEEKPQDEKIREEEAKQVKVNEETVEGVEHPQQEHEEMKLPEEERKPVEQLDKDEDRPQQDSGPTHEELPTGECDLFEGVWEHDPEGPLYTNSTCFYMQRDQDCLANGRPDTDYLYWRWKPWGCDLPRFDAKSFMDKFRGKAIGFVGDSIARNQMQSLLCLLSLVEIPVETYVSGDDKTVRWLYKEHQVMLAAVWSPYLVKESKEGEMGFEKGQSVLYLDVLDTAWTSVIQDFDIAVFLTGQWYYRRSVYIEQQEVIGCHYCPGLDLTEISFYQAYRRALRQVLEKVSGEYKGVAIMGTFPLSHFENGTWDTGGYCKRQQPLQPLETERFPGDHSNMHDIVIEAFNGVVNKNRELKRDTRLEILDVTKVSLQRADGHPGPFRRHHPFVGWDPNVYYPNDCLHWCLPGPIDTWNQLVVKIIDKYL